MSRWAPNPAGDSPEKRAAWHSAFAALGPVDGIDLRAQPDGSLLDMRATYAVEMALGTSACRPRNVGVAGARIHAVMRMISRKFADGVAGIGEPSARAILWAILWAITCGEATRRCR